jgi:hypothetical protein
MFPCLSNARVFENSLLSLVEWLSNKLANKSQTEYSAGMFANWQWHRN